MHHAFTELLAAGDAEARAMLGVPAVFARRNAAYVTAPLILAPAEAEVVYAAGGAELRVKASGTVRKADLPQAPAVGDSVTCGGQRFFVVNVASTPQDVVYHLTLDN